MTRASTLLTGIVLACAFSLLLNAADLRSFQGGSLNVASVGANTGSADEAYYFALIHEVRDGFWSMGNSSFREYRTAPSLTGYALLPQGLLARWTSLDLPTVILIGDLLFPAIIGFLLFLIGRALFEKTPEAVLFASAFLLQWNFGLLRTMNPQVTMSVFFFAFFLFVSDRDCRHPWRRGIALALAVLVQPICALLLLVLESLDMIVAGLRTPPFASVVRSRIRVFLPPFIAGAAQSVWVALHTDQATLADLSARRGLTLSHLPSDPALSAYLLAFGVLAYLLSRRASHREPRHVLMVMLAVSGLVVLNQQIVHGHEAIFGLYYHIPLVFFLWLMTALLFREWVSRRILLASLSVACLVAAVQFAPIARSVWTEQAAASSSFAESDLPAVLSALARLPGERVVLAPIEVSNLVPVFTSDYTLFTQYAHFEYVSDVELAERYLLQRRLFPLPEIQTVEGDPLVFGLAAGNLYARQKTVCRLERRMGLRSRDCDALKLPDFIRHQDVRRFVDAGSVDPLALLVKYGVDTVISATPLVVPLADHCHQSGAAGAYTVYDCRFGS